MKNKDNIFFIFDRSDGVQKNMNNGTCGNGICDSYETKSNCSKDCDEVTCREIYASNEKGCIDKGWQKLYVDVDGIKRELLWKGPEKWENGAIIVMHGGEGVDSNFCYPIPEEHNFLLNDILRGVPAVQFGEMALEQGFAVFSLNSTYNRVSDDMGRSVGKRWDSLVQDNKENIDLAFIEKVINETIPNLRPENSKKNIFMTGISNGGFMTILAATYFSDKISAFVPVSAGDPYGTYFDMTPNILIDKLRPCGPGVWRDNETGKNVSESDSCASDNYSHEKAWPVIKKSIPFRQLHNKGDGIFDMSCMKKVNKFLIEKGYKDDGAFIIDNGKKNVTEHFWQTEYNQPILDFFKKYSIN